ncbi:MAG TPA: pectinesterase family protein, partial [Acidobacteriaceae bacterium]|nr:pectinesterase family protein [Acidobacteriaceae bacterium]
QENLTTFPTIQNALDHHPFATPNPDGTPGRVYIEVAPGTYHERIIITQNHSNITLIGLGKSPEDVVITNSLNARTAGGTFFTETVEINGTGFEADNITFENAAGNTGQAVAVADRSDRSIFKHCRFLGHQDTLFADYGRQYYVDSYIEGGVDYIFGNAAAVFDSDELHSNGPGSITAQSRTSPDQNTGYIILNSKVTADLNAPPGSPSSAPAPNAPGAQSTASARRMILLGRPWRAYGRAIFINTSLPAEVNPLGWDRWGSPNNEKTAYYAESGDTGPGASPSTRVPWSHQLTAAEVKQYLPRNFLAGPKSGPDHWDPIAEAAKLP